MPGDLVGEIGRGMDKWTVESVDGLIKVCVGGWMDSCKTLATDGGDFGVQPGHSS